MSEQERLSNCCNAPVREAEMVAFDRGLGRGWVCTKCGEYARTRMVWNGLPPIGSFEQQLGERYEPVVDYRAGSRRRRR